MKRRTVDQPATGKGVVIVTRSGNVMSLPRKEISGRAKESVTITDFSSVNPCARCGTEPRYDGSLPSAGGILRVYAIHLGIWTAYAGACDCVFGAWRTIERRTNEGPIPPIRYVDDLPGIPPGLSTDEWSLLNLYKVTGDSYSQAAARIPKSTAGSTEVVRLIEAWEDRQWAMPAESSISQPSQPSTQAELIGVK